MGFNPESELKYQPEKFPVVLVPQAQGLTVLGGVTHPKGGHPEPDVGARLTAEGLGVVGPLSRAPGGTRMSRSPSAKSS